MLLGTGIAMFGLSGCVGGSTSGNTDTAGTNRDTTTEEEDIEYEQCPKSVIPVYQLPGPAEGEATTAIVEGVYETGDYLVLSEVLNLNEAAIIKDNIYYKMSVRKDSGVTRLHSEEIHPKINSPGSVQNEMDTDATVTLRLTWEGESILQDTFEMAPRERFSLDDQAGFRYGSYRATLTISTENETREEVVSWEYGYTRRGATIDISADRVDVIQPHSDPPECRWNDDGTRKYSWE